MKATPTIKEARSFHVPYVGPFGRDRAEVRVKDIKKAEEIIEWLVGKVEKLQETLDNISGICVNYDGYTDIHGLKGLIDDIKEMADKALEEKND